MTTPERISLLGFSYMLEGDGSLSLRGTITDAGLLTPRPEYIAVSALSTAPEVQELIRAAVEKERERSQSERPFIMGANHGYDTAMDQVVEEAQRFAEMYPQSSDGRNTFEIFADWARRMKDGPAFAAAIRAGE